VMFWRAWSSMLRSKLALLRRMNLEESARISERNVSSGML